MWVRAQMDYLQRLPTDVEKQRALKELPPTLPDIYVRIFETIDHSYPVQTTKYIQRLLKWLVLGTDSAYDIGNQYAIGLPAPLRHVDDLCQAISLEQVQDDRSPAVTITSRQLFSWLGCLIRSDGKVIDLSHFTVKEFLQMRPENVSSSIARKFIVRQNDLNYLLKTCLTCVMHRDFAQQRRSSISDIQVFLQKERFYKYSMWYLIPLIWEVKNVGLDVECEKMLREFLAVPVHPSFGLWDSCSAINRGTVPLPLNGATYTPIGRCFLSPLHFAAVIGSITEVQRLLSRVGDYEALSLPVGRPTPLHLAIYVGCPYPLSSYDYSYITLSEYNDSHWYETSDAKGYHGLDFRRKSSLPMIQVLLNSGADVDRQCLVKFEGLRAGHQDVMALVTPLTIAAYCDCWQAADMLLGNNAKWNAIKDYELVQDDESIQDIVNRYSMEDMLEIPRFQSLLQCVTKSAKYPYLGKAFEDWKVRHPNCDVGQHDKCDGPEV